MARGGAAATEPPPTQVNRQEAWRVRRTFCRPRPTSAKVNTNASPTSGEGKRWQTDRYGREVGEILVDGVDANLEQLKKGLAWHYKAYVITSKNSNKKMYRLGPGASTGTAVYITLDFKIDSSST
jgi:hypothetical protein